MKEMSKNLGGAVGSKYIEPIRSHLLDGRYPDFRRIRFRSCLRYLSVSAQQPYLAGFWPASDMLE